MSGSSGIGDFGANSGATGREEKAGEPASLSYMAAACKTQVGRGTIPTATTGEGAPMAWWNRLTNKPRGVYGSAGPDRAARAGGCDHSTISLREGTAEFEWFVARGELETKHDLKHGASHLANLLTYDPGEPEWIELLEQYLAAAGKDPESLFPRGDKLYYGTEAVRAYIWHKQGRLLEAIELLENVIRAKSDARYMEAWGLNWLERAGAIESLPEQTGLWILSGALGRFPESSHSPLHRMREARRWAGLAERYFKAHRGGARELMLRAGLLRKAGMFDEALAALRPA